MSQRGSLGPPGRSWVTSWVTFVGHIACLRGSLSTCHAVMVVAVVMVMVMMMVVVVVMVMVLNPECGGGGVLSLRES